MFARYRVVINYARDDQRAESALKDLRRAGGDGLLVKADIGRSGQAARLIDEAIKAFGRIDVVINNAAYVADAPALDMTEAQWDRVMDVNLKGAFLVSQASARHMVSQDSGAESSSTLAPPPEYEEGVTASIPVHPKPDL